MQEGQIVRVRALTGQEEAAPAVAAAADMRGARFADVWYFDPTPNPRTFCSLANETTAYPALIPHEAAASSRRRPAIPHWQGRKVLLTAGIPADSRSARKRRDRPVTPEVAGSSPVAPALKVPARGGFSFRRSLPARSRDGVWMGP